MLFKQVIGHHHLQQKLKESVPAGRISHAQLFLGINGTGALPLALAYAQYVNCLAPTSEDSCGECHSCRKMQSLEHPDLHFSFPIITKQGRRPISAEYMKEWRDTLKDNPYLNYHDWMDVLEAENKQGNITAEESRDIIRKLSLKPMYEGFKIMIIWLPEYMGKEGNILLKILEEPPAQTLFILVAENEELILPTILSRTQLIRVPRISDNDLAPALVKTLSISDDAAGRLCNMAEGNYNDALKLFKASENNYTEEFIQWMRLCYKADMGAIIKWADGMAGTGRENQKNFLIYGLNLLRECLIKGQNLDGMVRALETEKTFIENFSKLVSVHNIGGLANAFNTAHYYVERNANPKILLFNLSLQINGFLRQQQISA